jgi:hypothetical protein
MTDCKSAPTPFLSRIKLEDDRETPFVDNTLYKKLVGSLLYLTHSIPDLSYAVGAISRFMQELLASEVTPGLLAGAEPNAHQFYVTICLMG